MRDIHKTVRICQEVYDYIEKQPGTTWNDRFNNCIEDVIHYEDKRKAKIMALDKQIEEKKTQLHSLEEVINTAKAMLNLKGWW